MRTAPRKRPTTTALRAHAASADKGAIRILPDRHTLCIPRPDPTTFSTGSLKLPTHTVAGHCAHLEVDFA